MHPDTWLAGVYYVKSSKGSGDIYFRNPNTTQDFIDLYYPTGLHRRVSLSPEEGYLYLFPGYLRHGVGENESHEDRIAISFNIQFPRWEWVSKYYKEVYSKTDRKWFTMMDLDTQQQFNNEY